MLTFALAVVPIIFASRTDKPVTATLLVALAAAAHQGWSANISRSRPTPFARHAVAHGGRIRRDGRARSGGMGIAKVTGSSRADRRYMPVFLIAGSGISRAHLIIHLLVPKLEPVVAEDSARQSREDPGVDAIESSDQQEPRNGVRRLALETGLSRHVVVPASARPPMPRRGGCGARRREPSAGPPQPSHGACWRSSGRAQRTGGRAGPRRAAHGPERRGPPPAPSLVVPRPLPAAGLRASATASASEPGHVRALRAGGRSITPVFAQQSIREMTRTGRSPQTWWTRCDVGQLQAGWTGGRGRRDHLKTPDDIAPRRRRFTMLHHDPGEHVDPPRRFTRARPGPGLHGRRCPGAPRGHRRVDAGPVTPGAPSTSRAGRCGSTDAG